MSYGRLLYARVVIDANPPSERAFQARKAAGERRMRAAGLREASILRYLRRGWPSQWARAVRLEMAQSVEDIGRGLPHWSTRGRQRRLDEAEARRLMGCE